MRKWRAFTLVELLVVVAIIGILATVVVISYSGAQKKARDARRKSDVNTISQAAQLFFTDNGTYKISMKTVVNGTTGAGYNGTSQGWFNEGDGTGTTYPNSIANGLVSWGYLSTAPSDPNGSIGSAGAYMYYTDGPTYSVFAHLESPNPASGWDASSDTGGTGDDALTTTGYTMNYRKGNGY